MKLKEFLESAFYLNFLDELDDFLPEKIDRASKVYILISNILDKWLSIASISVSDLEWLISHESESVIKYILKKQKAYTEPNGGEDNIVNEIPNRSFPISHLIEYCLLSKRPDDLLEYVAKIRIPGPKKYAKEIVEMFSEIKSS
jgi:hypothetical protein